MSTAETYIDVTAELLAYLLKFDQHDVRITGARGMEHGVVRLYLGGEHLPDGQLKAIWCKVHGQQVLEGLVPV